MIILEFVAGFLKDNAMTLASIALVFYTAKLHSATKRYADITEKMLEETGKQIAADEIMLAETKKQIAASEAMVEETKNQVRAMHLLVTSIEQVPDGIKRAIKPLTQKAREEMAEKRSEKLTEAQSKINRGR